MARLTVISDSHLSGRTPEADQNWSAVLRHVEASRPDLVVHAGDLSLDGAHDPEDLEFGRSRLDRLAVPWLAVPGNHDVGDNPTPGHNAIDFDGVRHAWAPASWAVLPENAQRSVGVKQCGILSVDLSDGQAAQVKFVEPAGLRQLTITEDIPDPYAR